MLQLDRVESTDGRLAAEVGPDEGHQPLHGGELQLTLAKAPIRFEVVCHH